MVQIFWCFFKLHTLIIYFFPYESQGSCKIRLRMMKALKISIYAVTGTEIRSWKSSIMHPEINLEEMLKEVWDHLSLSTIMVSGPTGNCHGNDLTSTKLTVLMSVDQGVPIHWSDAEHQNTDWTRGRM